MYLVLTLKALATFCHTVSNTFQMFKIIAVTTTSILPASLHGQGCRLSWEELQWGFLSIVMDEEGDVSLSCVLGDLGECGHNCVVQSLCLVQILL